MVDIGQSSGGRRRRDEVVLEEVETEGDRQVKELLKRQLNTDVTIEQWVQSVFTGTCIYSNY